MRIARVLFASHAGSDAAADAESLVTPRLGLERDGALYDAGELDRAFGTRFSPDRLAGASDFHTRTVALAGAGLDELDERLRAGDRPGQARLLPCTFTWLPPCDTDRAILVQMAPYDEPHAEPAHRLGDARGLLAHESCAPFPAGERRPSFELGIAAVLRDDLRDADATSAERAILGYAILNAWSGGDDDARPPAWSARRVPAQLGPVLVTPDELGELGRLKVQARVGGKVVAGTSVGGWAFSLAESIAWVSRWMDLRAGDVIGGGCVHGGRGAVAFGITVEVAVERMGRLVGRALEREG